MLRTPGPSLLLVETGGVGAPCRTAARAANRPPGPRGESPAWLSIGLFSEVDRPALDDHRPCPQCDRAAAYGSLTLKRPAVMSPGGSFLGPGGAVGWRIAAGETLSANRTLASVRSWMVAAGFRLEEPNVWHSGEPGSMSGSSIAQSKSYSADRAESSPDRLSRARGSAHASRARVRGPRGGAPCSPVLPVRPPRA